MTEHDIKFPIALPLDWIRVFVSAARHESFVLAGKDLDVTPSAVSHRIKSLEQYLGVTLFERKPSGIFLTDTGRKYAHALATPVQQLERATELITSNDRAYTLRLTVMPSLSDLWLIRRLDDFFCTYPNVSIDISADTAVLDLASVGLDIGLRWGDGNFPGYRSLELFGEELFPVATPEFIDKHNILSPDDLAATPLICDLNWKRDWESWFRAANVGCPAHSSYDFFSLYGLAVNAALRGRGVLMAHSVLVHEHLKNGALVEMFDLRIQADFKYYAVTEESKVNQPHVRAFLDWLVSQSRQPI